MTTQMKLPSDYLKQGWCQESFARDADGISVPPDDTGAVSWCHLGAAKAAFGPAAEEDIRHHRYMDALQEVIIRKHSLSVLCVNDNIYDPDKGGQEIVVEEAMEAERRAGLR